MIIEFVQIGNSYPDEYLRNKWYVRRCSKEELEWYKLDQKLLMESWDGCQVASGSWYQIPWFYLHKNGTWRENNNFYFNTKEEAESVLIHRVPDCAETREIVDPYDRFDSQTVARRSRRP